MASVQFENVCVDYPVYMLEAKRLRANFLHRLSFGRLGARRNERIVVSALKNITLNVDSGTRLGIIGLNGAGKTTLLQTVTGILEPSQGLRRVEGRVTALYNIGIGFDPEASGYENIRLRGLIMGLPPEEIEALVPDVERFTELGEFLKLPIRTYSAGMQVKLAFAIATSVVPEVLVMDEWIGAGDAMFKQRAHERLARVVESSSLFLLTSHAESLIKDNCDQAILLHRGEIVEHAGVEEVYNAYRNLIARQAPEGSGAW